MQIDIEIKQKAKSIGFDLVGITTANPIDTAYIEYFKKWLSAGCRGKMRWLAKDIKKRFNPALLLPGAQSIICTAINYKTAKQSPNIASYALYPDYHIYIKNKLFELADFIKNKISKNLQPVRSKTSLMTDGCQRQPASNGLKFKICVDSSPLAERALACRAGLGFIGKNQLLTNPHLGSFLLLGELVTNLPLKPDKPTAKKDYCQNCTRCIDACPTGALSANNYFNAGKCISYLTIEHKSRVPEKLKSKISPHFFGCEMCIIACPYNEKAPVCKNRDFKLSPDRQKISPEQILKLSQNDFDALFGDSPINRTGLRQLKRNALICVKKIKNKK